jgi:GcrA cell cycle regulator
VVRNAWCFDWTDAAIARLKALWAEGLSASECGKRMGVSRNAVIGKIHRLGLSHKYRRPRERARRMTKPKASMPQMRTNNRPLPPPEPYQAPPPTEEPRRGSFDLLDLKLGQCRYPSGDGPYRFCGAPVVDGFPYCLEHAELCYNKPGAARAAA